MNTFLKITTMVLRVCYIAIIMLGILLWTGNFANLRGIHMMVGILIVLGLWSIGIIQAMQGGSGLLTLACLVLGASLVFLGITQDNWLKDSSAHWIVQVIHFALGLTTLGVIEMVYAHTRRSGLVKPNHPPLKEGPNL
jgi:hypothetical protein